MAPIMVPLTALPALLTGRPSGRGSSAGGPTNRSAPGVALPQAGFAGVLR